MGLVTLWQFQCMMATTFESLRSDSPGCRLHVNVSLSLLGPHEGGLLALGLAHRLVRADWHVREGVESSIPFAVVLRFATPILPSLFGDGNAALHSNFRLFRLVSPSTFHVCLAHHTHRFVSTATLVLSCPFPWRRFAFVRRPSAPLRPTCRARGVRPRSPCPPWIVSSASLRKQPRRCDPVRANVVRRASTMRMATNATSLPHHSNVTLVVNSNRVNTGWGVYSREAGEVWKRWWTYRQEKLG